MSRGLYGTTVVNARDYQEDRLRSIRRENATAFSSYVETETAAGRRPDPMQLQRMRWSLSNSAAGSSYGAAALPATTQIAEITRRANEQVDNLVATETNQRLADTNQISQAAGSIVASMPSASDDDIQAEFVSQFGEEAAPRIWETVNHRLPEFRTTGFQNEIDRFAQMGVLERSRTRGELSGLLSSLGASRYATEYLSTEFDQRAAAAAAAARSRALSNFINMPNETRARLASNPEMMPLYAEQYGFGALSDSEQAQVLAGITSTGNNEITSGIISNLQSQGLIEGAAGLTTNRDEAALLQSINVAAQPLNRNYTSLSDVEPAVLDFVGLTESTVYQAQYASMTAQAQEIANGQVSQAESAVTSFEEDIQSDGALFGAPEASRQILSVMASTGLLPTADPGAINRFVESLDVPPEGFTPTTLGAALQEAGLMRTAAQIRQMALDEVTGGMPPPGTTVSAYVANNIAEIDANPGYQLDSITSPEHRETSLSGLRALRQAAEAALSTRGAAFIGNGEDARALFDHIDRLIAEISAVEFPEPAAASPAFAAPPPIAPPVPSRGPDMPLERADITEDHFRAASEATQDLPSHPWAAGYRAEAIASALGLDPRRDAGIIRNIDNQLLRSRAP